MGFMNEVTPIFKSRNETMDFRAGFGQLLTWHVNSFIGEL